MSGATSVDRATSEALPNLDLLEAVFKRGFWLGKLSISMVDFPAMFHCRRVAPHCSPCRRRGRQMLYSMIFIFYYNILCFFTKESYVISYILLHIIVLY